MCYRSCRSVKRQQYLENSPKNNIINKNKYHHYNQHRYLRLKNHHPIKKIGKNLIYPSRHTTIEIYFGRSIILITYISKFH